MLRILIDLYLLAGAFTANIAGKKMNQSLSWPAWLVSNSALIVGWPVLWTIALINVHRLNKEKTSI